MLISCSCVNKACSRLEIPNAAIEDFKTEVVTTLENFKTKTIDSNRTKSDLLHTLSSIQGSSQRIQISSLVKKRPSSAGSTRVLPVLGPSRFLSPVHTTRPSSAMAVGNSSSAMPKKKFSSDSDDFGDHSPVHYGSTISDSIYQPLLLRVETNTKLTNILKSFIVSVVNWQCLQCPRAYFKIYQCICDYLVLQIDTLVTTAVQQMHKEVSQSLNANCIKLIQENETWTDNLHRFLESVNASMVADAALSGDRQRQQQQQQQQQQQLQRSDNMICVSPHGQQLSQCFQWLCCVGNTALITTNSQATRASVHRDVSILADEYLTSIQTKFNDWETLTSQSRLQIKELKDVCMHRLEHLCSLHKTLYRVFQSNAKITFSDTNESSSHRTGALSLFQELQRSYRNILMHIKDSFLKMDQFYSRTTTRIRIISKSMMEKKIAALEKAKEKIKMASSEVESIVTMHCRDLCRKTRSRCRPTYVG